MLFKKFFKEIPKLPLSALIFYLVLFILWNINIIPEPKGILIFLESLYNSYGLIGLFIASFLEGVVYLGLYFPGSFIIALSVFLSDGKFISLLMITSVVTVSLTLTSIVNYLLGRVFYKEFNHNVERKKIASKGIFFAILHPNLLAFYYFNSGIEKQSPLRIVLAPILMIPYGLVLTYLLYFLKNPARKAIESPYIMITLILLWIIVAFILEHKRQLRKYKDIVLS
ncbi:hypothetical protein HY212_07725 [Candidatus Pacearchaeota archaeon]|nr:hypothetical protein [Candidatus Pacearchaeota archaeon]